MNHHNHNNQETEKIDNIKVDDSSIELGHSHKNKSKHSHNHHLNELEGKRLITTIALNLTISIVQIIGGLFSNSLSLLSDALHNFSDGLALWLTYITEKVSAKKINKYKTYGYKRAPIISAFTNAFVLILVCIYLIYEAYQRFLNPQEVNGGLLTIVATVGLFANLFSVILLYKIKGNNLNIKSAYLHLVGDTLSSVAVIIGGILIYYYQIYIIDPILTILIAIYIGKEAYTVLFETIEILMQSTPSHIELDNIKIYSKTIDNIISIKTLHIWSLDDKNLVLECKICVSEDLKISESEIIKSKFNKYLLDNYHIHKTNIEFIFINKKDENNQNNEKIDN